jgi:hypothetical protein
MRSLSKINRLPNIRYLPIRKYVSRVIIFLEIIAHHLFIPNHSKRSDIIFFLLRINPIFEAPGIKLQPILYQYLYLIKKKYLPPFISKQPCMDCTLTNKRVIRIHLIPKYFMGTFRTIISTADRHSGSTTPLKK